MTSLWILPPAVVVAGAVPIGLAATRLAAELKALRDDLDAWASLRPSLSHLNDGTNVLVDRFQRLRDR